jgi:hypothetical protein
VCCKGLTSAGQGAYQMVLTNAFHSKMLVNAFQEGACQCIPRWCLSMHSRKVLVNAFQEGACQCIPGRCLSMHSRKVLINARQGACSLTHIRVLTHACQGGLSLQRIANAASLNAMSFQLAYFSCVTPFVSRGGGVISVLRAKHLRTVLVTYPGCHSICVPKRWTLSLCCRRESDEE